MRKPLCVFARSCYDTKTLPYTISLIPTSRRARVTLLVMLLHIMVCMDVWSKITLRSTILLQASACDAIHTHTTVSHASRTKPGVTDVKCRLASGSLMRALTPGAPALPANT